MSIADKSANRSAMKARAFNPRSGPIVRKVAPPKDSWWVVGAAPADRARFMEAAHQRAAAVWTNVAPHAMSPRGKLQ